MGDERKTNLELFHVTAPRSICLLKFNIRVNVVVVDKLLLVSSGVATSKAAGHHLRNYKVKCYLFRVDYRRQQQAIEGGAQSSKFLIDLDAF